MIGIVDVGGGMRGSFGAGVFDWCLGNGVSFDNVYGVSAGSANAVAYLGRQAGRNLRYYRDYSMRPEYMSLKNFVKTGSYLNLRYIYGTLSNSDGEDPLDYPAMVKSGRTSAWLPLPQRLVNRFILVWMTFTRMTTVLWTPPPVYQ